MSEENKINGLRIGNARVSDLLNTAIKRVDGVAVNTTAFSTGLLDTYGSAVAAYSVRRLNSNYTGACMRVRRTSDQTETDIGFNAAGHVDVQAIRDHCGSSNGFIRYWYDQSQTGGTGSGNDAGQSTAGSQPQIYNGTAVLTENGKPVIGFDSLKSLTTGISVSATAATSFIVGGTQNGGNYGLGATSTSGLFYGIGQDNDTNNGFFNFSITSTHINGSSVSHIRNTIYDGLASQGLLTTRYTVSTAFVYELSYRHSSLFDDAQYQEFILYHSDQSTNRTGIETDINGYFSIY